MTKSLGALALCLMLGVAACTTTSSPTVNPTNPPTSPPTNPPTAPPSGVLTVQTGGGAPATSVAVSFTVAGSVQTFTALESGYSGAFTITNTCTTGPVVTLAPGSANGPSAVYSLTSANAGTCSVTVSDSLGHSAIVNVTVTTTSGGIT